MTNGGSHERGTKKKVTGRKPQAKAKQRKPAGKLKDNLKTAGM